MERMRRGWRNPTSDMLPLLALTLSFGLGGLGGLLFGGAVDGQGGETLAQYLATYLQLAAQGTVPTSLLPILWEQLKLPLLCFALGFTALGVVAIPLLLGVRGFLLAYSATCFYRLFGSVGLVGAGFLFGLTALLTVPALFILGIQGMGGSGQLLRRSLGGRHTALPYDSGYFFRCGLCGLLVLCAILLEWLIVPPLLQSAAALLI